MARIIQKRAPNIPIVEGVFFSAARVSKNSLTINSFPRISPSDYQKILDLSIHAVVVSRKIEATKFFSFTREKKNGKIMRHFYKFCRQTTKYRRGARVWREGWLAQLFGLWHHIGDRDASWRNISRDIYSVAIGPICVFLNTTLDTLYKYRITVY